MITPAELEEMRRADEEIERLFERNPNPTAEERRMDAWLDTMAMYDRTPHDEWDKKVALRNAKKAQYANNADKIRAQKREHQRKNKEHYREYQKKYYQENRDAILARQREYDKAKREEHRQYYAERRKDPEFVARQRKSEREYMQRNSEKRKEYFKEYYQRKKAEKQKGASCATNQK